MSFRTAFYLSCAFMCSGSALANSPPEPIKPQSPLIERGETIGLGDARDGSLLFKTDQPGRYVKAPTVSTDVKMHVAGPIIRTTLSQTFQNVSPEWFEGIYVFPLPDNAAVDRMRIVVGGRFIEGQIKEKQQAKKIYETAKREGRKASLVEQERPNMFTASVANIGPGESVSIQIEYQDMADIKHGVASLVFPMTVAPRFSPEPETIQIASANGTMTAVLDPVLDRNRISPPLMNPKDESTDYIRLPVSIEVSLDAGFDIQTINSPYHTVTIDTVDADSAVIHLADGKVPANRDFKLTWNAALSQMPQKSVFKETLGNDTYLMTMFTPPQLSAVEQPIAHNRETIFVIDTSGSMGGTSIEQAREALELGLSRLTPGDNFNIIRFSNSETALFLKPQAATAENIQRALSWVSQLNAGGGTNMMPAMDRALKGDAPESRLKQVVFITDGAIGNETQLFALIQDELKSARLFPVGIGSAPNRFFMSRAAKFGRGTSVVIGDISEVNSEMGTLFTALENPVLRNLQISLKDTAESYPSRLPDLYDGEPVISVTKLASADLPQSLSVMGQYPGQTWQDAMSLASAAEANGISVLWARRKIADLEEKRFDRATVGDIDNAILQTALDHHLVSRLTSLVAVDITPSRDMSDPLHTAKVPTTLPEGWDFAALTGSPQQHVAAGPGADKLALRPQLSPAPVPQNINMPRTASPHWVLILLGAFMMALARLFRRPKLRVS